MSHRDGGRERRRQQHETEHRGLGGPLQHERAKQGKARPSERQRRPQHHTPTSTSQRDGGRGQQRQQHTAEQQSIGGPAQHDRAKRGQSERQQREHHTPHARRMATAGGDKSSAAAAAAHNRASWPRRATPQANGKRRGPGEHHVLAAAQGRGLAPPTRRSATASANAGKHRGVLRARPAAGDAPTLPHRATRFNHEPERSKASAGTIDRAHVHHEVARAQRARRPHQTAASQEHAYTAHRAVSHV